MAVQTIADRVKDTAASITGTGSYTLNGSPPTGFVSFATGIGDGNSTAYCATDGTNWEVCFGTYTDSTKALTRNLLSSSTGSLISWSAATPTVFAVDPGALASMALIGVNGTRRYAALGSGTFTAAVISAGQLKAVPVYVNQFFTSAQVEFAITAIFAGTATADVGLYDNLNGAPGNQIGLHTGINVGTGASTGAILSNSFSYVGKPGLYWATIAARTNSPTFQLQNSSSVLRGIMGIVSAADTNGLSGWTLTSASNPNPFGTPTGQVTGSNPVLALLVS